MTSAKALWEQTKTELPLIAILRGIRTDEALAVGSALQEAGYRCLEIPLNSPNAYRTIEVMAHEFGQDMLVGAGTVLSADAAKACIDAGGQLIVAPNLDESVALQSVSGECIYCPGVATPTEAFNALRMGASGLKLFPAELVIPAVVKAIRAVLPNDAIILPVGGISPDNMKDYYDAGATGFGLGSGLYKPGKSIDALNADAQRYVNSWRGCEHK